MTDKITIGHIFDTVYNGEIIEYGCVVDSLPDQLGNFNAYDSTGVLSGFHTAMVQNYGKMNPMERQRVWSRRIASHAKNCPDCEGENTCEMWPTLHLSYNGAWEL